MTIGRMTQIVIGTALALAAVLGGGYWTMFRVHVDVNECVVLIRKSGKPLEAGQVVASEGQKGIQRETLGPGRYFLNPVTYDVERHALVTIDAGDPSTWEDDYDPSNNDYQHMKAKGKLPEVGVLVNKVGRPAPVGEQVVGPEFQGIQRQVLTPGVYRINPYVYEVKKFPASVVPLGCVGIVTSQFGELPGVETVKETVVGPDGTVTEGQPKTVQKLAEPGQRGVLREVLQPGIYYLNPFEKTVQIIWVGYNLMSQTKKTSTAGDVINFPSKDGFTVQVDVTVVWGLHPAHAPEMVNHVGEAERIKQIILGQLRSICRNVGSDYESTDFIQGERRERYQRQVTETLRKVCEKRDIEVLIALIQNIEVHSGESAKSDLSLDLRRTIQRGYIAKEQDLTKQAQRETATVRAGLEASKAEIAVARERVTADTRMKVAQVKADADKKAQETAAQRDLEVAQIERQIAELDAETTRLLGRAAAQVDELKNKADADGKRMMVQAFGSGRAYNLFTFAEGFEPEQIRLFYAGEGTFWTDVSRLQDAAAMEILSKPKDK